MIYRGTWEMGGGTVFISACVSLRWLWPLGRRFLYKDFEAVFLREGLAYFNNAMLKRILHVLQ